MLVFNNFVRYIISLFVKYLIIRSGHWRFCIWNWWFFIRDKLVIWGYFVFRMLISYNMFVLFFYIGYYLIVEVCNVQVWTCSTYIKVCKMSKIWTSRSQVFVIFLLWFGWCQSKWPQVPIAIRVRSCCGIVIAFLVRETKHRKRLDEQSYTPGFLMQSETIWVVTGLCWA